MFESLEIRRVQNGVIVTIKSDDEEDKEYVYDTVRKSLRFVKEQLEKADTVQKD